MSENVIGPNVTAVVESVRASIVTIEVDLDIVLRSPPSYEPPPKHHPHHMMTQTFTIHVEDTRPWYEAMVAKARFQLTLVPRPKKGEEPPPVASVAEQIATWLEDVQEPALANEIRARFKS